MEKQLENEVINKIKNLYTAFEELNKVWSENENELQFLENEYPFEIDFTEQTLEVGYWLDYQTEYLNK